MSTTTHILRFCHQSQTHFYIHLHPLLSIYPQTSQSCPSFSSSFLHFLSNIIPLSLFLSCPVPEPSRLWIWSFPIPPQQPVLRPYGPRLTLSIPTLSLQQQQWCLLLPTPTQLHQSQLSAAGPWSTHRQRRDLVHPDDANPTNLPRHGHVHVVPHHLVLVRTLHPGFPRTEHSHLKAKEPKPLFMLPNQNHWGSTNLRFYPHKPSDSFPHRALPTSQTPNQLKQTWQRRTDRTQRQHSWRKTDQNRTYPQPQILGFNLLSL